MRVQKEKREKEIRKEGISSRRREAGEWWEVGRLVSGGKEGGGSEEGGRGRESLELLKVGEKRCYMDEGAN